MYVSFKSASLYWEFLAYPKPDLKLTRYRLWGIIEILLDEPVLKAGTKPLLACKKD